MVKVIDGVVEEEKIEKTLNLAQKLAIDVFGENRIGCIFTNAPFHPIAIYLKDRGYGVGNIYVFEKLIESRSEEDKEKCMKLAEDYEKAFNEEFTLKTFYRKK